MATNRQKSKMTIDKLAQMTQEEFLSVRNDMKKGFSDVRDDLKLFATKDDLKLFATKDDLRETEAKILQGVDKMVTRFDAAEKDHAAQDVLFQRMADELHDHDQRLKRIEAKV